MSKSTIIAQWIAPGFDTQKPRVVLEYTDGSMALCENRVSGSYCSNASKECGQTTTSSFAPTSRAGIHYLKYKSGLVMKPVVVQVTKPATATKCRWAEPINVRPTLRWPASVGVAVPKLAGDAQLRVSEFSKLIAVERAEIVRATYRWPFCAFANKNVELHFIGAHFFQCMHCKG